MLFSLNNLCYYADFSYLCTMFAIMVQKISQLFYDILELLLPRHCLICGRKLSATETAFCMPCLLTNPFKPMFSDCKDNKLVKLFMGIIPIERAQSLFRYLPGNELCNVIYSLKYHNAPEVGEILGRKAANALKDKGFFDGIDLLIPVPLTKKRKRQRGYNQAEVICMGLSEVTGIPVMNDNLVRIVFKGSQTKLSHFERMNNVRNNFAVIRPSDFANKHVLIVDDIITTGSTVKSCGEIIASGADNVKISVLSIGLAMC